VGSGEVAFDLLLEAAERLAALPLLAAFGAGHLGQAQDEDGEQMAYDLDVRLQRRAGRPAVLALQQLQGLPRGVLVGARGDQWPRVERPVDTGGVHGGGAQEAGLEEDDGAVGRGEAGAELVNLAGTHPQPVALGQRVLGEVHRAAQDARPHGDDLMERQPPG
jgi:hypothetical protein